MTATVPYAAVPDQRELVPPVDPAVSGTRTGVRPRGRVEREDQDRASTVIPAAGFDTWYRQQHPQVLAALTVASGSVDIATDATDEAFVRAYERWERVRRMDSPGGWLYRVALNLMKRHHRRRRLERELLRRSPPDVETPPVTLDPDLWAAVADLPTRQRTAVALRYIVDLAEHEVAEVMGVSRGAVSASLTTARRRLGRVVGLSVVPGAEAGEVDRG